MAEYIEREAALLEIEEWADTFCECDYVWPHVIKSIRNLPAADVRPVVKARWKPVMCVGNPNTQDRDEWYGDLFACEKCNRTMIGKSKYCPNCGADMRESKQESKQVGILEEES